MIFDSQKDSQIDFLFFSSNYNIQTVLNDIFWYPLPNVMKYFVWVKYL